MKNENLIIKIYNKHRDRIIQWLRNYFYTKNRIISILSVYFTKYDLVEFLIFVLISSIIDFSPPKNVEDFLNY